MSSLATRALQALVVLYGLLAIAAVFVMTLGTDEAWVLNGIRSTIRPQVAHLSSELITTSGGVFALANLVVEWLASGALWAHRSISLAFMVLALALVMKAGAASSTPAPVRWLMLGPLLAVPGLAEIGTAALGTSAGVCLMVASMLVWTSARASMRVRIVVGGLLYGLAAASRFDIVLFGFALLAVSCLRLRAGKLEFRLNAPAWGFVAVGIGVFLLNQWLMALPPNAGTPDHLASSAGLSQWALNYPKLFNHWLALSSFAPLAFLTTMAASAFWFTRDDTPDVDMPTHPGLKSLLAAAGAVLLVAWLFRAPIPHLRYALPGLFCFFALAAIGLQHVASRALAEGRALRLLLCQAIAAAALVGALGNLARSLVMSDSDYASWEWTHEMPYDYFRRFDAVVHQKAIAAFLRRDLEADAMVYSYVPYALRYLTERPVIAIDAPPPPSVSRIHRYLVLTPGVGTYFHMNPETAAWLKANARMIKQIGRYSVYRLPAGTDDDLASLKLRRLAYDHHPNSMSWFGR